jgi:hypothetical protein
MAGNRANAAGEGPWWCNLTAGAPGAYQGMAEFFLAGMEIRESLCPEPEPEPEPEPGASITSTRQVDSGGISPLRIAKRTRPGTS